MARQRCWQFPPIDRAARAAAASVGLKARRSRWRLGSHTNLGGFTLLDPRTNAVVAGERFELTPDDVVRICAEWQSVAQPTGIDGQD